ncbi:MAG: heavy metal sensor histidine kinase [Hyphomicrobium sp.]
MSSDRMQAAGGLVEAGDTDALRVAPGRALSTRLIAAFFSTAFLLVLAASAILYWGTVAALESADDQVVDKRGAVILDILRAKELNDGLLAHEVNEDNQGPRQIFIRFASPFEAIAIETEGMGRHLRREDFIDASTAMFDVPQRATVTTPAGDTFRTVSMRVRVLARPGPEEAVLQVATDTTLDKNGLANFRRVLFLVLGSALPLCAAAAWFLVNRELMPLARMAAATDAIDGANITQRLALDHLPAELHHLAMQFNSMLGRLERTLADLKHYGDTVAHEMRTPMSRMRLNCEIALAKATTTEEYSEVMISTVEECERLTRLLNGLLFLARADSRQAGLSTVRFSAAGQIAIIQEFFETTAAARGVSLSADCRPGIDLIADRDLFTQAIGNLVSNAISHTGAGGSVTVACETIGNDAAVHVTDTGSGIAPEDCTRVFERFYRAAGSANDGDRLGLGLAITKSIALLHGGRVVCESGVGRGTRMTLILPQPPAAM